MSKISRRVILNIVFGVLLIVGGVSAFRMLSANREEVERKPPGANLRKVLSERVENNDIIAEIPVTGKLSAFNKIELYAEVTGVLQPNSSRFREGNTFTQGQILLAINSDVPYQNLQSQKSEMLNSITLIMPDLKLDYPEAFPQWEQYLQEFDLSRPLKPLPQPEDDQVKYFITGKNLYNLYYQIKAQEAQLQKYVIRAPFTGIVTESTIKPGTLVRSGQKLGEFISTAVYEMKAAVSLKDIDFISINDKVELYSNDIAQTWTGTVKRINSRIDPSTQSASIYVHVSGSELKEGMYLNGRIRAETIEDAVQVPRKFVINDSLIYVIQDSVLQLHPIQVVKYTEENAIIRGLPDSQLIVNESIPNAREGMKVSTYQGS